MSKELTQQLIGTILTESAQRDAIHIAVAPMVAKCKVFPGQDVGLHPVTDTNTPHVGIVDPFLKEPVFPGQRYFIFLYPNTITGLRHEWTHPAFTSAATEPEPAKATSETWMREFAEHFSMDVAGVLAAGRDYVEGGEYHTLRFDIPDEAYTQAEAFWQHFEVLTGTKGPSDRKETPFTCWC